MRKYFFVSVVLIAILVISFIIKQGGNNEVQHIDDEKTKQTIDQQSNDEELNQEDDKKGNNDSPSNENNTENNEGIVAKIVEEMSLDLKIGQMILGGIDGDTVTDETRSLLLDYSLGGLIFFAENLETPAQTVQLLNDIKDVNKDNEFPLFLAIDEEGGRVSRMPSGVTKLPTSWSVGLKNDSSYSYQIGTLLGKQLKEFGFNLNFAPVLDVNNNPENPVIGDRAFGDLPEVVIQQGTEVMLGIQSENIIPTVKHFPGHGDTTVDSHYDLPVIPKTIEDLRSLELLPFQQAIQEGADMVMTAHILLPEIDSTYPASLSKEVITNILREELKFEGIVITDDMTMGGITNQYTIYDAAVQSVKAGTDIILIAHHSENIRAVFETLKTAVETGEISEERINESVQRIILLKQKYKLNNNRIDSIDIERLNDEVNTIIK